MRVKPSNTYDHAASTVETAAARVLIYQPTSTAIDIEITRPDGGTTTVRVIAPGGHGVRMVLTRHADDTSHGEQPREAKDGE